MADRRRSDRGAAAVEMAIVLPLLLLMIGGIIDMGRLLFGQVMVTNAAREGVRIVAMKGTSTDAQTRARDSMPEFAQLVNDNNAAQVDILSVCSGASTTAEVRVRSTNFDWLLLDAFTPITNPQLSSTAEMRCGG